MTKINDSLKEKVRGILTQLENLLEKEGEKPASREPLFQVDEFQDSQAILNGYKVNIAKIKGNLKTLFSMER